MTTYTTEKILEIYPISIYRYTSYASHYFFRQRCQNRRKFDPNQSSTFTPSDKKWQAIAYGGGSAAGILGSDQVKVSYWYTVEFLSFFS
ncbi:hypothetical protein Y032_0670g1367 [Ancylostoma ceylanicum]|uniref:Peptidase A1 domain-containing protein n=1 Tax=Ancylostoma ceylanicum TaxID=53326 RepID=A0A016WJJ6_9BILA|nr:hypothetical protein Y032_0670g1367 [Ancylostoma ceylanicum]